YTTLFRSPLPALALTTDTSVLTAIGNDYGFDHLFERQVRGLGRPGDVLIAISTSGRSPNIIAALQAAREMGLTTVGFTGSGPRAMAAFCDLCLCAPSDETPQIQQVHIVAAHVICGLVESELFGRPAASSASAATADLPERCHPVGRELASHLQNPRHAPYPCARRRPLRARAASQGDRGC